MAHKHKSRRKSTSKQVNSSRTAAASATAANQTSIQASIFQSNQAVQDESESLSLRSYLEKHLNSKMGDMDEAVTSQQEAIETRFPLPNDPYKKPEAYHTGLHLNSLDTELSAGLEQYIPTQMTRLRVVKSRLTEEVSAHREKLSRFEQVGPLSSEMMETQKQLAQRLETLLAHERQVDQEISTMLAAVSPTSAWAFQLSNSFLTAQSQLSRLSGNIQDQLGANGLFQWADPHCKDLHQLNSQLNDLTGLLQQMTTSKQPLSAEELSSVVNRCDQMLRKSETLAAEMQTQTSLWQQFSHWMKTSSDAEHSAG